MKFFFNKLFRYVKSGANGGYEIEHEGTGKTKLIGASYVITNEKVLILNVNNEVIAQYDIEDEFVAPPPTLTSTGTPGQKAWDGSFLYYCISTNVWIKLLPESADLSIENLFVAVPATLTSTGLQGTLSYDNVSKYLYVCVATNTWVRFLVTEELEYQDVYAAVPPTPTSTGSQGQRAYDSANGYMYECVATNTWVRYAVTTF